MESFHQTLESSGRAMEDSAGVLGLQARFSLAVPEQMATKNQLKAGGAGQLLTVFARLRLHDTGLRSFDLDLQSSDSDLYSSYSECRFLHPAG